jgi:hypothetical protein
VKCIFCLSLLLCSVAAVAQQPMSMPMTSGSGMAGMMDRGNHTFLQQIEHHASSGTSAEPNSTPTPMWMTMHGDWMLMFHANAFITDEQQTSQRGGDKFFSTNWFMPMVQRQLGPGVLTLRTMLSLEPATITDRQYPLLFQQGETAYGKPIVDGQHPHNFVMELAALYDWKLGEKSLIPRLDQPPIRIGLRHLKIPWARSDIIRRIRLTFPTT